MNAILAKSPSLCRWLTDIKEILTQHLAHDSAFYFMFFPTVLMSGAELKSNFTASSSPSPLEWQLI